MNIEKLAPVRYSPSLDPLEDDEREVTDRLCEVFDQIQQTTFEDEHKPLRGVHAKSHGILDAKLEIPEGLPPVLAQGVFSRPGVHDVIMRFSTTPSDLMSDKVSTPRGLAIKIQDVDGERLEGDGSQDFLMVNGPTFSAPNAKAFLKSLKLLAGTTDKAEWAKRGLSGVLRGAEAAIETVSGKSTALRALGGEPPNHILGETFFSQLPQRFGDYIAKLRIMPCSQDLKALTGQRLDLSESDTIIRDEVVRFFGTHSGVWELSAQLCTDLDDTPITEPSRTWEERLSPFYPIARITAPPQLAWSDEIEMTRDASLRFNPWNGVQDHKPLGAIMRIRRDVYRHAQAFRQSHMQAGVLSSGTRASYRS